MQEEGARCLSSSLGRSVRLWGGGCSLNKSGRRALQAAHPRNNSIPPMKVAGSTVLLLVFAPEDKVRSVRVRVVEYLPYRCILDDIFLKSHNSRLSFRPRQIFQISYGDAWVPLERRHKAVRPSRQLSTLQWRAIPKHAYKEDHNLINRDLVTDTWSRYCSIRPSLKKSTNNANDLRGW